MWASVRNILEAASQWKPAKLLRGVFFLGGGGRLTYPGIDLGESAIYQNQMKPNSISILTYIITILHALLMFHKRIEMNNRSLAFGNSYLPKVLRFGLQSLAYKAPSFLAYRASFKSC